LASVFRSTLQHPGKDEKQRGTGFPMLDEFGHRRGKESALLVQVSEAIHRHRRCAGQQFQAEQADVILIGGHLHSSAVILLWREPRQFVLCQ
jgi:hypothetical protein